MSIQQKPSRKIANLCTDIMLLAIATADKQADAFVEYKGHINSIEVQIHSGGWKSGIHADHQSTIILNVSEHNPEKEIIAKLDAKIKTIKQLK